VNLAVYFDDEAGFLTEKIDNEAVDSVLASKFVFKLFTPQLLPESILSRGWSLSFFLGEWSELTPEMSRRLPAL
jgi:hypothetical protein